MANPEQGGSIWRCAACGTVSVVTAPATRCPACGAGRHEREPPGGTLPPGVFGETHLVLRPSRGRVFGALTWAYAAVVIAGLVLIRWVGDDWWPVTLLLFSPRWLFLGPVAVLAVASGLSRRFGHWPLQASIGLVVAGPLMGFSLPIRPLWEALPAGGERVRVVTFNRGARPTRQEQLRDWLARERVDVVCLQESERSPEGTRRLLGDGWHVSREGSVASRFPIVGELPPYGERMDDHGRWPGKLERVRVRTPSGSEFLVASVHLPTVRFGLERFLDGDVAGLRLHSAWWGREMGRVLSALAEVEGVPMVVGGDFNMPSDDSTMAALRAHFRFAYEDSAWGYGYTKPTRLPWIRIDHVLAGPEWYAASARVGPDFGSDHLPLLAELVLVRPPRPAPTSSTGPVGTAVAAPGGRG